MITITRPAHINDALDILSSCYAELDLMGAMGIMSLQDVEGILSIDHAMAYLEKEYTSVR